MLRYSVPHFLLNSGRVLNGGTQRRVLPPHHAEHMKVLDISFTRVAIEPVVFAVTRLSPYGMTGLILWFSFKFCF